MPANKADVNMSSGKKSPRLTKIHQGNDFDDLIQNAMNASSHDDDANQDIADDNSFDGDLERGSMSTGSDADDLSLESDDLSVVSESCDKDGDKDDHEDEDSYVSNVPLVNDDESVIQMKNPAPVSHSQSVESYVDTLNRRERGKSRLIKAGLFAIFIAVIVGLSLAVISVTGSKDKGVGDTSLSESQNDKDFNDDEINIDALFRSVEATMDGALSVSGLVIPVGGLQAVKDIFETTIAETVTNALTKDQTVMDISVSSINDGSGRVIYRVLKDHISVVEYEMTVKERCRDCNQLTLEGMRDALYQQVASNFIDSIDTGVFTDNLHKQARNQGVNTLLSAIIVDGNVEGYPATSTSAQSIIEISPPTEQPTPQRIPEFFLPQVTLPPPTSSPVTRTTSPTTLAPITLAPITPSPTLSPTTTSPITGAPFPLPLVEFAPTDPPTPQPTFRPTPRPSPRPTPRPSPRPTPRPTPKPTTKRPTPMPVVISSDSWFCAKASYTANWNILLEFGECDKRCPSMSSSDCEPGYQCRQSDECLELVGLP